MSDFFYLKVMGVVAVVIVSGVVGGLVVKDSAPGEFDRICYQHNPNWTYQADSAQYWNSTLNITCQQRIEADKTLGTVHEWEKQAELQLKEVEQ